MEPGNLGTTRSPNQWQMGQGVYCSYLEVRVVTTKPLWCELEPLKLVGFSSGLGLLGALPITTQEVKALIWKQTFLVGSSQ